MVQDSHNAAPNAVGYLHQTRWGLVELLRSGPDRPDAAVSLELYDDVAWDQAGSPTELLQVKHHQGDHRALTDRAVDVWKTLKVWMDTITVGDLNGPSLVLVTTQAAASGSAMELLRSTGRNEESARSFLEEIAAEEGAEKTRAARQQFLALSPSERRAFVHRIRVEDSSPHAEDVDQSVRRYLQWALPPGHENLFLAMVWKWWDDQALRLLQGRITSLDVGVAQAAIGYIRDEFTNGDLPTLIHVSETDRDDIVENHRTRPFVQQMQWVAFPPRNLQKAIIDYYRAYTQAVRWLDEDLVGINELEKFEHELIDEWEREFEWMLDGLHEDADEKTKQEAGKQLLRTLLGQTGINIRARYNDPFFARGQRHVLSDTGRIGWHADFEARIKEILHVHA